LPQRNQGSWLIWDKRTPSQAEGFGSEFETCWSRTRHKRRMLRHPWFGMFAGADDSKDARSRVHPTQKPVSLYAAILTAWTSTGDLVLDPYAGSGTTLIAADQTSRRAALIEIDPAYCDVICMRWQQHSGQAATRESDGEAFRSPVDSDGWDGT
jgi:DNA modification methylase